MKMTAQRLHLLLIGLVGLGLILLIIGALGANNFLKAKSAAVYDARLESLVQEEKQRQLTKAKADIAKYESLAEIAKSIVPQDKDQAQTVREIVAIAAQHNIRLGGITFPTSTLGDSKQTDSQLQAVKDIPGVFSLEITIQSDEDAPASFANFISFLDALEHNRRTALVNGITLQPKDDDPSKLTFTLTLNEFIKP